MISFRTKYTLVSALVILIIISIITLNLDNGTHTKYVGEVIGTRYNSFPTPHTDIIYGLTPAPSKSTGQPEGIKLTDGIYKETITYRGDLRQLISKGEYYMVTDQKTSFTLYPEIVEVRLSEISTRTFIVTGFGTSGNLIETVSRIHPSDLEFKGDYSGSFTRGHTYELTYFGDILLKYTEIS